MGLFSNSSPNIHGGSLELFKPPLGIDPSYCVNQETTLIIKTSAWDVDYNVTDSPGNIVVRCEGKALSKTKEIKHAQTGQLLFTISGKLTSHSEFGHDAAGKEVFEVKPKKGLGKTEIHILFTNTSSSSSTVLVLAADDRADSRAVLRLGDRPVAWLTKESKMISSTPHLMTVAPGVDLSFMAAICVCYDRIVTSKRASTNASLGGLLAVTS